MSSSSLLTTCLICYHFARYIVRDFVWSDEVLDKQREELELADSTEKELWVGTFYPH